MAEPRDSATDRIITNEPGSDARAAQQWWPLYLGLAIFGVFQLADVPLTVIALSHGAREVNPLIAALLSSGRDLMVAETLKLLIVAGLSCTTWALWRLYPRYARVQLLALVLLSVFLVLDSLMNIVRA